MGSMAFKALGQDYKPIAFDTTLCQNEKTTFTAGTGLVGETITWQNGSKDRTIGVHTEGGDSKTFTQERANAIVKYLIEKGINEKRITAKGYNNTQKNGVDLKIKDLK